MSDTVTVQGGPIAYSQTPVNYIARARRHIREAVASLETERQKCRQDHPKRALDITHIIHELKALDGQYDGYTWAYPMSLRRLEAQEGKP